MSSTFPADSGYSYGTLTPTSPLNVPSHSDFENKLAEELQLLKLRALGMFYAGSYSSINTCIDAVNANGGGLIILPANTIMQATAKLRMGDNVGIMGQGYGSVIKLANAVNTNLIEVFDLTNGNTGLLLSNLRLEGNSANQTSQVKGFYFRKVSKYIINNVWVRDFSGEGGYISYSSDYSVINGLWAYENGSHGLDIEGPAANPSSKLILENIFAYNNGQNHAIGGYGVKIYESNHIMFGKIFANGNYNYGLRVAYCNNISGNMIHATDNLENGVNITDSYEIDVDKMQVIDSTSINVILGAVYRCRFGSILSKSGGGHGIYVYGTPYGNRFDNIECYDNEWIGFMLDGGYDNLINGGKCLQNKQHGFRVYNSNDNKIIGITAKNNSYTVVGANDGFRCDGTSARNIFSACIAYDDQGTKTQRYGWTYGDTADYNIVSACQLAGNQSTSLVSNTHDVVNGDNIIA